MELDVEIEAAIASLCHACQLGLWGRPTPWAAPRLSVSSKAGVRGRASPGGLVFVSDIVAASHGSRAREGATVTARKLGTFEGPPLETRR